MKLSGYNEANLLTRLTAGDPSAFQELHDRFSPRLLAKLTQMVHDPDLAQDLLQDSFVKIWMHRAQYDPLKGRLFTWLYRIVHNVALTQLRLAKGTAQPIDACPAEWLGSVTPSYQQIGFQDWIRLTLPHSQHQAIELVYFLGYTYEEAADALALPIGTLKSRIHQALVRLRNSPESTGFR